jgi:hypothetical protein
MSNTIMTQEDVVLFFESSKEHYVADAVIFWCFDDRFRALLEEFIKFGSLKHVDVVDLDGGAKAFADDGSAEQALLLGRLGVSVRLHATKRVVLMVHVDCGAYGGSKAFASLEDERTRLAGDLAKAEAFIKAKYPDLEVERYIADFDGLRRIR